MTVQSRYEQTTLVVVTWCTWTTESKTAGRSQARSKGAASGGVTRTPPSPIAMGPAICVAEVVAS
jgi:hypothetical protein